MDHQTIFAAIPALLALLGIVWKLSALASKLTTLVDAFGKSQEKLDELDKIVIIERDLEQIKEAQAKLISEFPKVDKRLLRVEWKLGLTPSGMRPPSMHDIQAFVEEEAKKK